MLLMIIAILERLLGWLKSFTGEGRDSRDLHAQSDTSIPTDDDLLRAYGALKRKFPLKNAPSTKTCGAENMLTGKRVIDFAKQDSRVWDDLSNSFGEYYNIRIA